mmetsp:Transcript_72502/g.125777  ORF Transcript_72502/g.125777 Transcript_72502/m.125777 type:complete len:414 (+) Transcript_72502:72-1313(+)
MSRKQVAGYVLDKRIGKCSYATVWKGHTESDDEVVAVKVISRQTVREKAQLRQEVLVLRRVSHPNIVRFQDLKKSASNLYLVLEFCAGGDLSEFLKEHGYVQEETARKFLTQIAAGICMLHRENILHCDLKPQNILLSNGSTDPKLKIANFGFARVSQPQDMATTICGSPLYTAPEILRHEPYDAKADLWSVGAILYELLLGRPPFNGTNPMQLLANIEQSEGVGLGGAEVSSEGQEFLKSLLTKSPSQRLSSREFATDVYVRLSTLSDSCESMEGHAGAMVFDSAAAPHHPMQVINCSADSKFQAAPSGRGRVCHSHGAGLTFDRMASILTAPFVGTDFRIFKGLNRANEDVRVKSGDSVVAVKSRSMECLGLLNLFKILWWVFTKIRRQPLNAFLKFMSTCQVKQVQSVTE